MVAVCHRWRSKPDEQEGDRRGNKRSQAMFSAYASARGNARLFA